MSSWLLSFILGGGVVTALLALYLIPAAQPLLKWVGDNLPLLLEKIKEGMSDIMDSATTIVLVLAMLFMSYHYGRFEGARAGKEVLIKELRDGYQFVPKKKR